MMLDIWIIAFVLVLLPLYTSALEPLCAKPPATCSSVKNSTECINWSGCKFNGKECVINDQCDQLRCGLGDIGVKMSAKILPSCVRGQRAKCEAEIKAVHDAFELSEKCFLETPFKPDQLGSEPHFVQEVITATANTIFVSPNGLDSNTGANRSIPKRTLASAVARARSLAGTQTIVLMPGKHRLTETLVLTEDDGNLIFAGETGAIITAAQPINDVNWVLVAPNTYKAILPTSLLDNIGDLSVLSMANEPMIRARYPNVPGFWQSLFAHKSGVQSWVAKSSRIGPYNQKSKLLRPGGVRYTSFISASGGNCEGIFTPPTGFFCSPKADADGICQYSIGTQVTLTSKAANAAKMSTWANRGTGYFHMLHDLKWGGWTFKMNELGSGSNPRTIMFGEGGFQEARGSCKDRGDGDYFIENIRELMDSPNEYFLDMNEGALYFQTLEPISSLEKMNNMEIGAKISRLISLAGTNETSPVRNIQFRNIIFERTYPTHMSPHEMPSGGDWSLHRSGALFLEHVEGISVEDCTFQYLGSHAIFVSNRGRNVNILRNSFFGLDASAVMLVGDPKYSSATPWDRTTDTDYVSGVVVRHNVFSTIGLVEMQSSAVFGALTADVLIERNVMYNGPRAAICYNDLFGGSHITKHNVIFNMVRLTLDHGPYNVWDRQQWTLPSTIPKDMNVFEENFVIASESGPKAFCSDDGARDHLVKRNLLAYGYVKFKGSNMIGTENVILAFLNSRHAWCLYLCNGNDKVNAMQFYKNTCYTSNKVPYGWDKLPTKQKCTAPELQTYQNRFFGAKKQFHRCGDYKKWTRVRKQDKGSTFQAKGPIQNMLDSTQILVESFAL